MITDGETTRWSSKAEFMKASEVLDQHSRYGFLCLQSSRILLTDTMTIK